MGIKTLLYMFLVAFLVVIIGTPLVETFILGRDKVLLSSTIHNSLRAAEEASYSYMFMRNIDAQVDEEVFCNCFADTFATSYKMDCVDYGNPLRFVPYDDTFNEFIVDIDFSPSFALSVEEGGALITKVTVTVESAYRFRTELMRFMNDIVADPFVLRAEREYTMKVTN
ncbi:MAG: hypothetical protein FWH57_04565 [Oscillospiraceae bacterium]|nr:hypothetical protein [Oscillospiraceae bacterium]